MGLALSNGVVKEGSSKSKESFIYEQNLNTTPLQINQDFFQKRIAEERLMLSKDPKNIKLLKRVGDVYLANKKADKAKNYFNKAFLQNTDDEQVALKLAGTYMILGKPEKADQVLKMLVIKSNSELLHLHAVAKMALSDLGGSIKLLNEISSDSKNYYEAVNTEGLIHLMGGEISKASKCFVLSIESNPSYSPAKNNLAVSYKALGENDKAVKQYMRVIKEDPNYVVPFNNLFNILIEQEDVESAYKLMLSASHLSNADNEIQFRIAWSEMQLGQFQKAVESYYKVLEILPDNSNTLNNIGYCFENLAEYEQAINYFKRAATGSHVTLFPFRNLMVIYDKVGNFSKSRDYAKIVLNNDPNDAHALTFLGNGLIENEDWDEGLKNLLRAYEQKPDITSLYVSLAYLYADIFPDYEKGLEAVKYVLDRGMPGYEEIYNNYIHLLLVNDKIDEVKLFTDNLNTKHPVSLATLALYQLKLNNLDESKKLYKEARSVAGQQFKNKIKQREYFDFGNYYLLKGELVEARKNFSSIVDLGDKGFKYILTSAEKILADL